MRERERGMLKVVGYMREGCVEKQEARLRERQVERQRRKQRRARDGDGDQGSGRAEEKRRFASKQCAVGRAHRPPRHPEVLRALDLQVLGREGRPELEVDHVFR